MTTTKQQAPWIAPSILSADFARLGEEVRNVLAAGADVVHFDVMDNHYVPNLTIGPLVCEALRKHGITAPIDVHLMVKPVDRIIPDFAKAGASYITFHPEASEHIDRTLGSDPRMWLQVGTGVQSGHAAALPRLRARQGRHGAADVGQSRLRRAIVHPLHAAQDRRRCAQIIDRSGRDIRLEVDGGIKVDNIGAVAAAGADTFVAGSAIFNAKDYQATIAAMRERIAARK